MKRIDAATLSPDGRYVAFTLRDPEVPGGHVEICLLEPGTLGSIRCLLAGPEPKSGIAWAPDSKCLAFAMAPSNEPAAQVYTLNIDAPVPRRITSIPHGAIAPRWRPDGAALLFESPCDDGNPSRRADALAPRVYDAMPVRWWNRWLDARRPHPFVADIESPVPRDLLAETRFASRAGFRGVLLTLPHTTIETLQAQWSPDGQSIVFAAHADADELVRARTGPAIFRIPLAGGEPERLTPIGGGFTDPAFSRDGASLYALEKHWPDGYTQSEVVRLGLPGSVPVTLTPEWDRSVTSFAVAQDESLLLNAEDAGVPRIFRVARTGGPPVAVSEKTDGSVRGFAALSDHVLAMMETSARAPEIASLVGASGRIQRITGFNEERSESFDAPAPRHFWFRSSRGADIHNLIYLPPQFDASRKYPLITCIHGGPHVMAADTFYENWLNPHFLARPGCVVLCTNYSGSTGFGREFAESVEADVLELPGADLLEAISAVASQHEFVDESRQAAVGGSYGGYLVNWLLGQTSQFRCAVVHAGVINNLSQYGSSDCGFDREVRMRGPVWGGGGQWLEQNPLLGAGGFVTPTLITHGELDFRIPITEGLTTFKVLQRRGVPSRLVVFPDEGHFIAKRANSRVLWREVWSWMRRYLRPQERSD